MFQTEWPLLILKVGPKKEQFKETSKAIDPQLDQPLLKMLKILHELHCYLMLRIRFWPTNSDSFHFGLVLNLSCPFLAWVQVNQLCRHQSDDGAAFQRRVWCTVWSPYNFVLSCVLKAHQEVTIDPCMPMMEMQTFCNGMKQKAFQDKQNQLEKPRSSPSATPLLGQILFPCAHWEAQCRLAGCWNSNSWDQKKTHWSVAATKSNGMSV